MAGRRNKGTKTNSVDAHAFAVVLEEIRAQNKGFGEGQQLLREQMSTLGEQVSSLGEQMSSLREQMSAGFEDVNRRFERVDARFERVEGRLDRIENDVGLVKIAVIEHARELKEVRVALEKKVDRDEVEGIVLRVVAR